MLSALRNFILTKRNREREKYIRKLQTIQGQLQKELYFWDAKHVEERELIESLQNHISSLSDEVEDAKDALFSDIDYQSFPLGCEMIVKMQTQIEIGRRECNELNRRIEECKTQQSIMRKQLNEMNLRIEENNRYKICLLRRREQADRTILYWKTRISQQQLNKDNNASSK